MQRENIGTTTFSFEHMLRSKPGPSTLPAICERAIRLNLRRLQIWDNAPLPTASSGAWLHLIDHARRCDLELSLACRATGPDAVRRIIQYAATVPSPSLTAMLLSDNVPGMRRIIDALLPELERRQMRLAVENHPGMPATLLYEAISPYPAEQVGFCVDSTNSLRYFESPLEVLELLAPRAFCFHVKDYAIDYSDFGFAVRGAPVGEGLLNLEEYLDRLHALHPNGEIYVENWAPAAADEAMEAAWLERSLEAVRVAAAIAAHA